MANYGIPYQGSKDKIVHKIASIFPGAENFYDLFGGGFSVTHYMLMHHSKKYKQFYFNEIQSGNINLILDAIDGKYNYDSFKQKWISREDFFKNKDHDPYIRIIWSFGNNQKYYLFGKEIEPIKRSMHNAIIFNDFDTTVVNLLKITEWPKHLSIRGRRLFTRNIICKQKNRIGLKQLEQLEQLQRLQRLQQLQQLLQLEQLQQLQFSSMSYDEIKIKSNSVVYCDPPYKGTAKYLNEFDHDKFWNWFRNQTVPVFVSEYQAPEDVKIIMALRHQKTNSRTSVQSVEKLFCNQAALNSLKSNTL